MFSRLLPSRPKEVRLQCGLSYGLRYGLIFGVVVFLLSTILDESTKTLRLAERISWTWHALLRIRHLRRSLLVTVFLFCFFGLSDVLSYARSLELSDVLSDVLSVGLSYWLFLGLYQGIIQRHLEDRDRRHFNQGLHHSLRNSLLLSVLGGGLLTGIILLSIGLSDWLRYTLRLELSDWLRYTLRYGLSVGLSDWLLLFLCGWFILWASMGGLSILRHYTLRVLLARNHLFPLNARRFLDDAVARVLLKRQGGGYAFVHRRLLDYYAGTASKTPRAEKKA